MATCSDRASGQRLWGAANLTFELRQEGWVDLGCEAATPSYSASASALSTAACSGVKALPVCAASWFS